MSATDYKPGDQVAEYYWSFGTPRVRLTEVRRLTDTQIVTETGGRFRRGSGPNGYTPDGIGARRSWVLLPINDQRVQATVITSTLSALYVNLERLFRERPRNPKVSDAVAMCDKAEALIAKTRDAIASAAEATGNV
jgi:hypothetical protein